ncbi:phosphodiesterase [Cupriavidus basilensis]|uniref:Phosphodiesterase n=1 Tax=Cupriavidus basilensis TaxID=68895 RepID=A0A643FPR8_9BURK|nr:phosphodiesterase [Cupriavidus basilensis]QOT81291.1 phosphodiesterase [Cupriavidus basilensis]
MSIAKCIEQEQLSAVFQPIGYLASGEILGYEALIRGPAGTALESPQALFEQARREGCMVRLERSAARVCISAFAKTGLPGKLFLNFSAQAIREIVSSKRDVRQFLGAVQFSVERIVIELTEQTSPEPLASLVSSIRVLRDGGAQFALDDYGQGNANLSLWIALQPDYVKVDRAIVDGVANSAFRLAALRCLQVLANAGNATLIAEGLETVEDLTVCRDIGIACAQGFVLGKPHATPSASLEEQALAAIAAVSIAVFPEAVKLAPRTFSASRFLTNAPSVLPATCNNDVLDILTARPMLHAVAVVKDGRPVGLINRRTFVDAYALPYHRELFGKKSCMEFANASPVLVETGATVEQLAQLMTSEDQRYLSDGLVIVEQGRYVGLATGEDLVRAVTEVRIEAARYANPLTFLPGNMPIDAHIKRLVESGAPFHACYCDLNSFKPFNDQYGYWLGDEMLKLAAGVLSEACDQCKDFLGHVGGDDFLILFQSEDWESRIRTAMKRFNASAVQLYEPSDIEAGGIQSEDRHGDLRFYAFVTIAVGVVPVGPGSDIDSNAIATLAAAAKREAKRSGDSFYVCGPELLQVTKTGLI